MNDIGFLRKSDERYEFYYPELGLIIRGSYAEWVLEAAGEIIARAEKMRAEGQIDELATLAEFGEAAEIEVESARFDANARFEAIPQCVVSMGTIDYHWVSPDGRGAGEDHMGLRRIHDTSRTRNDSFLKNVDGVDSSST